MLATAQDDEVLYETWQNARRGSVVNKYLYFRSTISTVQGICCLFLFFSRLRSYEHSWVGGGAGAWALEVGDR